MVNYPGINPTPNIVSVFNHSDVNVEISLK